MWTAMGGAALSAVLLSFCFPFASFWWLAWVALVPWYTVLIRAQGSAKLGFQSGFAFGLVLHLVGMFWMTKLDVVPWAILSVVESGWFAVMGAIAAPLILRSPNQYVRAFVFAALWTLLEYARSWGSCAFPWFLLAATQVPCLPMVQVVSLTGQWGLSFFVASVSGIVAEAQMFWRLREQSTAQRLGLLALAIPAVLASGGAIALNLLGQQKSDPANTRVIGIVQGNIGKVPEGIDADEYEKYRWEALQTYLNMTRNVVSQSKPRHAFILWPETVVPGYMLQDVILHSQISRLASETGTSLLVGTMDATDQGQKKYNSVVHLDSKGIVQGKYAKKRLVPMGEFFLFREQLGNIYEKYNVPNDDLTPGTEPGVFTVNVGAPDATQIGMLICYESVFPDISRDRVRQGAQLLVQATSDETFDETPNPQQHADLAVLRAVETRRDFMRAGASGLSEVIDSGGHVRRKLPSLKAGTISETVTLRTGETFFVRFGDWFVGLCAGFTVLATLMALLRKRPASAATPTPSNAEDAPAV